MRLTKNNIKIIISLTLVVLLALLINQTKTLTPLERYRDMQVSYNEDLGIAIERYLVQNRENPEEFLVAPTIPADLAVSLIPKSSANVLVNIEPLYLPRDCSLNQIGLSTLQLGSSSNQANGINITLNRIYEEDLSVTANQGLDVVLDDGRNGRCGKVTLTFHKKSNALPYLAIFLLVWSTLSLLLAFFNIDPIIAAFGAFLNILFVYANTTITAATLINFSTTILFCLCIVGLILLLNSLPLWRWLKTLLATASISLPFGLATIYIVYPQLFSSPINEDSIHAVLQSNLRQGIEFWQAFVGIKLTLALILALFTLLAISYLFTKNTAKKLATMVAGLSLFAPALFALPTTISNTPILAMTSESITGYFEELTRFKELREERLSELNEIGASLKVDNQTLVVVLGESASKHHMSSYGYGRDTNPNADRLIRSGEMIRFDAAYSNHVHSNPTISRALTSASNYKNEDWINSPSILNAANAAGIKTAWVSNKPMYGVWDNHMNVIGNEAEEVSFINKRVGTQKYSNEHDAAMLPLVYQSISASKNNELVFMHLQGSHVHYCARVPIGFDYFKEYPEKNVYGSFLNPGKNQDLITRFINCYDNSIRYSDYVLNELIERLNSQEKPSAVLYISDHGENVMDNKAHNASEFDYFMAEIPAYFWANNEWRMQYQSTWQNLVSNREKIFTNDYLFELVTGLAGVDSAVIDTRNDLSSQDYIEPESPKTMHGEVQLNAPDNWSFWQPENLRSLRDSNHLTKIIAANSNTVSKAGTMIAQGLAAIQLDLYLQNDGDNASLFVGFDPNKSTEISLYDFVSKLDSSQIAQLWLTAHNLENTNINATLRQLNELNENTQLTEKPTLIINRKNSEYKELFENGIQLAYALDEQDISILTQGNRLERQKMFEEVHAFAKSIGASTISLPADHFAENKQELDLLVKDGIDLQLSLPSNIDLATPNLSSVISDTDYFNDPRVNSISLKVNSRHNL